MSDVGVDLPPIMGGLDASDIWRMGVKRLAVVNGPNIFQMLLVLKICRERKNVKQRIVEY